VIRLAQVGLSPRADTFILYIIYLCLFALLGSGIGLLIGATVLDVKKALTASVIIVLGSVLLGGFFIAQANLRAWIRWARWTSFMKYTYELMLLNEFDLGNQNYTPSTPSTFNSNPITGNDILNRLNVETTIWADVRLSLSLSLAQHFRNSPNSLCRHADHFHCRHDHPHAFPGLPLPPLPQQAQVLDLCASQPSLARL
jgi:hypothetical protein